MDRAGDGVWLAVCMEVVGDSLAVCMLLLVVDDGEADDGEGGWLAVGRPFASMAKWRMVAVLKKIITMYPK